MNEDVWLSIVWKFCVGESHELGRRRDVGEQLANVCQISEAGNGGGRSEIVDVAYDEIAEYPRLLKLERLSGAGLTKHFHFAFSTTSFVNTSLEHCALTIEISPTTSELKALAV